MNIATVPIKVMGPAAVPGSIKDDLPWWINPVWLFLFFLVPLYVLVYLTPILFGPQIVVLRFLTYFTESYFLLGLVFLLVIVNGAVVGGVCFGPQALQPHAMWVRKGFLDFLALVTITAYVTWFHRILLDPKAWLTLLRLGGESISVGRQNNPTIGGVTTAVQFGIAYYVMYFSVLLRDRSQKLPVRYTAYAVAILALTVFRVVAWAERSALLEIAIPVALLLSSHGRPRFFFRRRLLVSLAPLVGVATLLLFFAATEWLRSWSQYYQQKGGGFWWFAFSRLVSYYYTALNNGAGLLKLYDWPTWHFGSMLGWLYRFPVFGVFARFVLGSRDTAAAYLSRFGDVEFNNMSGIFTVFYDVGVGGGLVVAFLWGSLMGYLYRTFRYKNGLGIVLFPITYISMLEVMRIFYLGTSRAFPAIVVVIVGYVFFIRREKQRSALPQDNRAYLRIC